jgi:hypothetical protein
MLPLRHFLFATTPPFIFAAASLIFFHAMLPQPRHARSAARAH